MTGILYYVFPSYWCDSFMKTHFLNCCVQRVNLLYYQTHTKRQTTPHDCLPSLLGDGDKEIKIVYGEDKHFVLGRLEQPRQNKNLLYRHDNPTDQSRKDPFKFVLFESPFASVFNSQQWPPFSSLSS
jgi:hypothetical protein